MKYLISVICLLLVAGTVFAAPGEAPLKLGVLSFRPKPQTLAQWQPVAAYLQSALKRPVELTAYDHEEFSAVTAQHAVDLVITTPSHYILLQHTPGLSGPLATVITRDGSHELSTFGGVIFTRADRDDIRSLKDLSGKRIAAATTDAFGGYQMQAHEMHVAGVPLPAGDRLLLTGQPHDRVVDAVLTGRAEVGFVRAGVLELLAQERKLDLRKVKVVNRQELPSFPYAVSTRLYPEWPVAVMPHVDRELAGHLAAILFLLPHDSFTDSAAVIHGFSIPASYDAVEQLLRHLRLPPFDRDPEITPADLWRSYAAWIIALAGLLLLLIVASAGLIALYRRSRQLAEKEKLLLSSLAEGVYGIDTLGDCIFANPRALAMLGFGEGETIGKNAHQLFHSRREADFPSPHAECPATLTLSDGRKREVEDVFIRRDGSLFPVSLAVSAMRHQGAIVGAVVAFQDITERRRSDAINAARLHLVQFSLDHSLDELLEETLNETERLTGSLIGFYHFVEADQTTLTLQNWSTRTKTEFCRAEGKGLHYAIENAGVWVDCVRQRRAVIHNDYASLPHRKGMPEGHAQVVRELVVPVFRGEKLSAILGVGNKPSDYTEKDIETISLIAGLAWEIAERKRTEEALQASEERFRRLAENARDVIFRMSLPDGAYEYMSPAVNELTGFAPEEFYRNPNLLLEFIHPDWRQYILDERSKLMSGEMPPTYEFQIIHKSGDVRWVNQRNILIQDEHGNPVAIEGIVTEITERKRAEEELRSLNEELEQKVRIRTSELEAKNLDLEKLNKIFVGRELRMVELKEKIRTLEGK